MKMKIQNVNDDTENKLHQGLQKLPLIHELCKNNKIICYLSFQKNNFVGFNVQYS